MSATQTSSTAGTRYLRARKLAQQRSVAPDRHGAVRFLFDPRPPSRAHLGEVVLAIVHVADRTRQELGTSRRDDEPAADALDHLDGLALGLGGDDDWTGY